MAHFKGHITISETFNSFTYFNNISQKTLRSRYTYGHLNSLKSLYGREPQRTHTLRAPNAFPSYRKKETFLRGI